MEVKLYVEWVTFALCSLTLVECWYVSHDVERGSVKTISQMMVNKIDRPNTTPTVFIDAGKLILNPEGICKVSRPKRLPKPLYNSFKSCSCTHGYG